MTADVRLFLLGGFRLENAEGQVLAISLRKAEALLAYLAMAPGKTASREKIATLLWGESDQQRARQSLRQALFALTREFAQAEVAVLRMESQMVSLNAEAIWVDASEFEALIAVGGAERLAEATRLYTGGFLQGFTVDSPDFDDWLMSMRSRMEEAALKAFVELLGYQEEAGEISAAIETAQGALRIDGYREDVHRRLMRLYVASGMRSSALHQYRQCHDFLDRELGVPPDDETNALYRSILEQGPTEAPDFDQALEAQGARPAPVSGRAAVPGSGSVMVGRAEQLRALTQCLMEAREGRCRLVIAVGEAGVGKSHLLDRFLSDVGKYDAVGLLARGRRSERSLDLALWADLLSRGALAADAELDQAFGTVVRDELALFRPDRFPTAGKGEGGGHDRRRLYDAVVELIRARSAQQPLVLVFDDLQWADEQSLQLISFAVRHLAGAPVLFVASARSDEIARGPLSDLLRDLERDDLLSLISLRPLSREETDELVRRLQQTPEGKSEPKLRSSDIWALSEGNPRIIVETLAENAEPDGTARSHKPRLPKRVFTEVSRALVSLGEGARELANMACVMGPRVDYDVLSQSAGLDQEAAVRGVEELVAAQILEPDGDDLVFARKRVRQALYESLLPQRRRALHAAAARAIEETRADAIEPHFEVLAHHYREAGDGAKGLEYELAAGLIELKRGARNSARKLFERALKAVRDLGGDAGVRALEVDARLGLGTIAETEQDLATAAAIFSDLESHFDRIEKPQRRVATLLALSRIQYMRKDVDGAYDYARRALAEAGRAGGGGVWPPADSLLVRFHLINGALDRTADELKKRQERTRKFQLGEDEADTTAALGVLYALRGDFSAAVAECQRAVELAESLGNERCLAASLQFRGMVGMWRGSLGDALADFDKAAEIAAERGDLLRLYTLFGHRGFALAAARRYDEAMAAFKSALEMATRLNTKIFRPLFMAWRAEASFELGRHEDALHGGREACQMAAASNQTWARSVALRTLARVLAHPEVRDLSGAERSIRSALADQEGLGIKFETARSMVVQAKIMRSAGQTRQSSAVYDEASKLFQQMQMTSEFDSASHMAEALRPGGDTSV